MENASKQFRKRNAILACVKQSHSHPSAEDVYRTLHTQDSDISLATVYRNLALFRQQGLIISLGTVDGIERFDGCVTPHSHFVCSSCGGVEDIPALELPESIPQSVAQSLGCRVDAAHLMISGRCRNCLAE